MTMNYAVTVGQALAVTIANAVRAAGGEVIGIDQVRATVTTVYVTGPWATARKLQDVLFTAVPGPSIRVSRASKGRN